jgi:hypothetical protein
MKHFLDEPDLQKLSQLLSNRSALLLVKSSQTLRDRLGVRQGIK